MKKNVSKKEIETSIEVSTVTKNIYLDGYDFLRAKKIITTYEVVKTLSPSSGRYKLLSKNLVSERYEDLIYPLAKCTSDDLLFMRKNEIPYFVLKINGDLYFSEIPEDLCLTNSKIIGPHLCGLYNHECKRLSASSDEEGGCAKVRNSSRFIEKYPWITDGFETFGTTCDCFKVAKCLHYKASPSSKKRKK